MIAQRKGARFRFKRKVAFHLNASALAPRRALDRYRHMTRAGAGGELERVRAGERARSAGIPHSGAAEHGRTVVAEGREYGIQTPLVIANQLAPAAHAVIKVIGKQDAAQRIEFA